MIFSVMRSLNKFEHSVICFIKQHKMDYLSNLSNLDILCLICSFLFYLSIPAIVYFILDSPLGKFWVLLLCFVFPKTMMLLAMLIVVSLFGAYVEDARKQKVEAAEEDRQRRIQWHREQEESKREEERQHRELIAKERVKRATLLETKGRQLRSKGPCIEITLHDDDLIG